MGDRRVLSEISTFEDSFKAFASSSVWILIGDFGLDAALESCGIIKRITLKLVQKFVCGGDLEKQSRIL